MSSPRSGLLPSSHGVSPHLTGRAICGRSDPSFVSVSAAPKSTGRAANAIDSREQQRHTAARWLPGAQTIIRRLSAIAAAVLLCAFSPAAVFGQRDSVPAAVTRYLRTYERAGITFRGVILHGAVAQGDESGVSIQLHAGTQYTFIGYCDSDCSDATVQVLDAGGNVIETSEEDFLVQLIPARSGTYRIQMKILSCSAAPCVFAVGFFTR
jgi:hypothetical protein